jgi:hypothetical protein
LAVNSSERKLLVGVMRTSKKALLAVTLDLLATKNKLVETRFV